MGISSDDSHLAYPGSRWPLAVGEVKAARPTLAETQLVQARRWVCRAASGEHWQSAATALPSLMFVGESLQQLPGGQRIE